MGTGKVHLGLKRTDSAVQRLANQLAKAGTPSRAFDLIGAQTIGGETLTAEVARKYSQAVLGWEGGGSA
jgi:hypothetical protein